MELKWNVRKFLFSSMYVTAAISGHDFCMVRKVDLQLNKDRNVIILRDLRS